MLKPHLHSSSLILLNLIFYYLYDHLNAVPVDISDKNL